MNLGEIIYDFRHKKDHKMSQQIIAEKLGVSRMYISMLENNYNPATKKPINPSISFVKKCSEVMNIPIDDLIKMLDKEQIIYLDEDKHDAQITPPAICLVYGSIPAGVPMELIEDIIDTEEIPASWLKGGNEYFGLKIKGKSMFPKYDDGDVVLFKKQPTCESGQDCVVMVNGNDGTFKKVYLSKSGITLQPINVTDFEPITYSNEEIESLPVKILGVAVEIRRKV